MIHFLDLSAEFFRLINKNTNRTLRGGLMVVLLNSELYIAQETSRYKHNGGVVLLSLFFSVILSL